jgi:hypothetical protein
LEEDVVLLVEAAWPVDTIGADSVPDQRVPGASALNGVVATFVVAEGDEAATDGPIAAADSPFDGLPGCAPLGRATAAFVAAIAGPMS